MTKFLLIVFLYSSSLIAKANELNSCGQIEDIQFAMSLIASNIANIETTRTPEGGPYRRKELRCNFGYCEILEHAQGILKYWPEHIDANEDGYVEFPDIDLLDEIATMIDLTREYERELFKCQ